MRRGSAVQERLPRDKWMVGHLLECVGVCQIPPLAVGFVLEGFDLNYNKAGLADLLVASTECLPDNKPRFAHGLQSPGEWHTHSHHE